MKVDPATAIASGHNSKASALRCSCNWPWTPDWMDIKNGLPDDMTTVLVCLTSEFVTIGFLCDGNWVLELDKIWLRGDEAVEVTHWTPLPKPPTVL